VHIRAALVHAKAILTQLAALASTPDFDRLVQTMQRARSIVPRHRLHYGPGVMDEPAEIRLHDILGKTRPTVEGITDLDHYTGATVDLTQAVAEFFDQVYVMDDNPERRAARLGLLAAITELGEQTLTWAHLHT
jgi:glycyl-tRNA synthetase